MTRKLFIAVAALLSAGSAHAGESYTPSEVYELFTSQGCSSCPPANAQVDQASKRDDVLALSYGVTYWDYLGWKDTFAKPEFTERQRAYVKSLGGRNAYTPQIILNGKSHSPRMHGLGEAGQLGGGVALTEVAGELQATGEGKALLVSYTPGAQDVPVKRGENGGRTVSVTNVVTDVDYVQLPHSFEPKSGQAYALLKHGSDMSIKSAAVWTP